MFKKFFLLLFFLINTNSAFTHTKHYNFLNKLSYNIYRNNNNIGYNEYEFIRKNSQLIVRSNTFFEVKKLGLKIYSFHSISEEIYENGTLHHFSSETKQGNKNRFCNIREKNKKLFINGSSYKGKVPKKFIIGNWWNHGILNHKYQIKPTSCRIIKQKVDFLGKEKIIINDKEYLSLKFSIFSSDKSLSDEGSQIIYMWFDEKSLILLKSRYKKLGTWEYRLNFYN